MAILNDLTPAIVDVVIPQGSDIKEFFQLYRDAEQTIPMDLTGFTARSMIRTSYDSRTTVLSLSTDDNTIKLGAKIDNGIVVNDDPANGGIVLSYEASLTSAIRFSGEQYDYVRDIELTDQNNITKRILQGTFSITREVTR